MEKHWHHNSLSTLAKCPAIANCRPPSFIPFACSPWLCSVSLLPPYKRRALRERERWRRTGRRWRRRRLSRRSLESGRFGLIWRPSSQSLVINLSLSLSHSLCVLFYSLCGILSANWCAIYHYCNIWLGKEFLAEPDGSLDSLPRLWSPVLHALKSSLKFGTRVGV